MTKYEEDINRKVSAIEAYYNGKLYGIYINMNTANRIIPSEIKSKLSFRFINIYEKRDNKLFWTLLRNNYSKQK